MERSTQILRLEIDGRWSAEDFGQALVSISDLYDLRLFLELVREDQREWELFYEELMHFPPFRHRWRKRFPYWGLVPWALGFPGALPPVLDDAQLSRLSQLLEPEERLEVRRISYASPGATDLAGIGTVIGHIKDFILKLIERQDSKRQRELDQERAALENDRIRLENARNFVALARDLGYSETDLRRLVLYVDGKQGTLVRLIAQQKLRGVSIPEAGGEQ
ncbi:MAG: hypothetical protein ACP5ON_11370 [Bacteroidota bacterium]